jgi:hypothetical protein
MCQHDTPTSSRAAFLGSLGGAVASALLPVRAFAQSAPWWEAPVDRYLHITRQDDGEQYDFRWFAARQVQHDGRVGPGIDWDGYLAGCQALRDRHPTNAKGVVAIAPLLFQVLWEIQQAHYRLGYRGRIIVHSGYRSFVTNEDTEGSARDSQHVHGDAADFHFSDAPLAVTGNLAGRAPLRGGYGYYPAGWIHIDVRNGKADW